MYRTLENIGASSDAGRNQNHSQLFWRLHRMFSNRQKLKGRKFIMLGSLTEMHLENLKGMGYSIVYKNNVWVQGRRTMRKFTKWYFITTSICLIRKHDFFESLCFSMLLYGFEHKDIALWRRNTRIIFTIIWPIILKVLFVDILNINFNYRMVMIPQKRTISK